MGGTATAPARDKKQNKTTLPELMEEAKVSYPVLESLGNDLAAQMHRDNPALKSVNFEMGPIKGEQRAGDKIQSDYQGDASQIGDLVRGRFVADTPEQLAAIKKELDKLDVVSFSDRFTDPTSTGYRDMNYKIRLPNGHIAEIQIVDRQMLAAAKLTHDPYEAAAKIKRTAEDQKRPMSADERKQYDGLMEKCRQIHGEAADKAGLNPMLSEKAKTDPRFIRSAGEHTSVTPEDNRVRAPPGEIEPIKAPPRAAGMSAGTLNLLMGGVSLYYDVRDKKPVGATIAVLNMASGAVTTTEAIAPGVIGKTAVKYAERAAVPLMVVQGVYDVATAPDGKKGVAAGKTAISVGTTMTIGAATAETAAAGGAAAVVGGVLLPVTAGIAAGWAFEKDIKITDLAHQHVARMEAIRPDTTNSSHLQSIAALMDQTMQAKKAELKKAGKPVPDEDFVRDKDGKIDLHNESNLQNLKIFMEKQREDLKAGIANTDQLSVLPGFAKGEAKLRTNMALEESLKTIDTANSELNSIETHYGYRAADDHTKSPQQISADIAAAEARLAKNPNDPSLQVYQFQYTMHREGAYGKSDSLTPASDSNPPIPDEVLRLYKADPAHNGVIKQMLYKQDEHGNLTPDKLVYWRIDDPQQRTDVVRDGGVRNRDGTTTEKGKLATTFNPGADGKTQPTMPTPATIPRNDKSAPAPGQSG